MRAVWYETAGSAAQVLTYGDMPDPQPGPDEVRVRVAWSAVNPTDVKRRQSGRELHLFDRAVPNNDGSGVIDAVGPGVPERRIGERVWIFGAQAGRAFGTSAEFTVVPAFQAIALPEAVSLEEGACLGVPAVTAHRGLFSDGPIEGHTVLVTGAAGRVGHYAVQMAKYMGARVIGTVGSKEKAEHVRALGADHVFNYKADDIPACVAGVTNGKGVHRIVEVAFGANIADGPKLVRPNGVITSYGSDAVAEPKLPFLPLMFANITLRPFSIYGMPETAKAAAFEAITRWLDAGALRHNIAMRLGFEEMVKAHETIQNGDAFGCVLVKIQDV